MGWKFVLQKVYIGFNQRKDSSFELFFFWQFVCMKTHIYTLYKMKIDVFKINKMLYGILIFIVEIYLVYLYNTYREQLLEKQWLLWNKINAEALIFFHCYWWLVLFAFFYNSQFQLKALLILVNLLIIWQLDYMKVLIYALYKV